MSAHRAHSGQKYAHNDAKEAARASGGIHRRPKGGRGRKYKNGSDDAARPPEANERFNYFTEIGRRMKWFGNDIVKLLIVVLLISVAVFAVTIIADLTLWAVIITGVWIFIVILLIALYGYWDED